jgi:membrane protease YdiL (CAAX protease family)
LGHFWIEPLSGVSCICFGFWHLGGGPLIIITTALNNLIFALLRWWTGGILGTILALGLMDFAGMLLLPNTDVVSLGRPNIAHLSWMGFGLVLIVAPPIYLWLFHSRIKCSFPR